MENTRTISNPSRQARDLREALDRVLFGVGRPPAPTRADWSKLRRDAYRDLADAARRRERGDRGADAYWQACLRSLESISLYEQIAHLD